MKPAWCVVCVECDPNTLTLRVEGTVIVFSSRNAQTLSEETCSPEANQKRVIQENAKNYQSVVSLGYKPFGWLTVNPPLAGWDVGTVTSPSPFAYVPLSIAPLKGPMDAWRGAEMAPWPAPQHTGSWAFLKF